MKIPNAVRPIRLAEFLPEFGDQVVYVWVNPPRDVLIRRAEQIKRAVSIRKQLGELKGLTDDQSKALVESLAKDLEQVGEQMIVWLAEIWSQHAEPETHFSVEDVKALANASIDQEPELYAWLIGQTMKLIAEHRKKK